MEGQGERNTATAWLEPLSPMRGKAFLKAEKSLKDSYDSTRVASTHAIFMRDKYDSTRSDFLLLNLLGAEIISVGSIMELAWAHLSGLFCIVIMENNNIHVHSFVREAASIIFDDLDEGVDYLIKTFKEPR